MSRLTHGLLTTVTALVVTSIATVAIARDHGWSLPVLSHREREPSPVTIVLHRAGGDVYAGADDSPTLRLSGILRRQGLAEVTIPPFRGTDGQWDRFVRCVEDRFDGYGVDVVQEVPTEGTYSLAVIGGTPDLLGYADTVGGIAPHADRVLESSVLFVFQPTGVGPRALCETAAHEIGHTLGLDHSRDCSDIMGYESCGPKEFRQAPAVCGEWEDRACDNGLAYQSSHDILAASVGLRPKAIEPPVEVAPTVVARPSIDVRRSARAVAGEPFSVAVDAGVAGEVDLFWYARRRHRLRCGETHDQIDFTCHQQGSVYTFTLTPTRAGPRKYNVRVTEPDGRMTKTSTYRVRFDRHGHR